MLKSFRCIADDKRSKEVRTLLSMPTAILSPTLSNSVRVIPLWFTGGMRNRTCFMQVISDKQITERVTNKINNHRRALGLTVSFIKSNGAVHGRRGSAVPCDAVFGSSILIFLLFPFRVNARNAAATRTPPTRGGIGVRGLGSCLNL